MQRLREAKIELSSSTRHRSTCRTSPLMRRKNPLFLDETITRAQFQQMTQDLLDRTKKPFEQVIGDAGISVGDIDHVVPRWWIDAYARHRFGEGTDGKDPNKGVNPDEVVAIGAALQAGVLKR